MGLMSILARLNLDASAFHGGLKSAESGAEKFAHKLKHQVGATLIGAFGVHALVHMGKEAIENGHKISQLAEKFNLTTDEVQQLQEEADRTGTSFEELVKNADELENILSKVRGGNVIFSREQVEQFENAHQVIEEFKRQAAVEGAKLLENPGGGFMRILENLGIAHRLGPAEAEAPNQLTPRQEAQLEADAKAKRRAAAELEEDKRVLEIQKQIGEIMEKTRLGQLSKEERLTELVRKRKELEDAPVKSREELAKNQLEMVKMDAEVAQLREDLLKAPAQRGLPPLSDSLTAIGNFLGANPNNGSLSELKSMNRKLEDIRRNTAQQGAAGTAFPL